jgi:hypothetical protein
VLPVSVYRRRGKNAKVFNLGDLEGKLYEIIISSWFS